jgi:hypothetical protein
LFVISIFPAGLYFGMGDDREELVGVALDPEVKAPGFGYASLPDVISFVVFLCPEGGVAEVLNEKVELLLKRALDCDWSGAKVAAESVSPLSAHAARGDSGSALVHVQI